MCSGPWANGGGRSRWGPGQCCSGLQGGAESGGRRAERSSAPIAAAQPATEARRRARGVAAQVRAGSGSSVGRAWVTPGASRSLPPRPGSVRFLGGIGRGRLAVPERAESGFPHVAEEAPGVLERVQGAGRRLQKRGARTGCGARSCGPLRALGGSREETLRDSYVGRGGERQFQGCCFRTPRVK